ncbi:MAG: hypothetical protein AYK18_08480 [Theionarchaea archaeon DG-70]|nr:MAG: hypothetical protein AYK18_08480 [Theionarchaea archaeon DG-70]
MLILTPPWIETGTESDRRKVKKSIKKEKSLFLNNKNMFFFPAVSVTAQPLYSTLSLILFLHFILPKSSLKALWYHHAVISYIEGIATIFGTGLRFLCKIYTFYGKF